MRTLRDRSLMGVGMARNVYQSTFLVVNEDGDELATFFKRIDAGSFVREQHWTMGKCRIVTTHGRVYRPVPWWISS